MADHEDGLGPVDRLLLLVTDGQSLSRRVLGNERQSARLGERLSCLKQPLWQLQAKVQTHGEVPPEFIHNLLEEVSHCLEVLLEFTHPDWWNQIRRKHDAAVFRDLNDRLVAAVKGDRVFESALAFPRAADEDRADRIVDFEHLQGVLELHAGRLEDRSPEQEELWKAIATLRLSEPTDVTGFTEIDPAELTYGSGAPLGGFGTCVEATWHGSCVAVKRLLTRPRSGGSNRSIGNGGSGGGGGGMSWNMTKPPAVVSSSAASVIRRQVRLLQTLRFEFLVPIYGACTGPPDAVSLVMPLAPHGSLHAFLHGGPRALPEMRAQARVLRRSSSIGSPSSSAGGSSDANHTLSAAEKAAMAFDVARGMLHLHSNGFLHGSLKCKNVMVFDNNRLMVSDYGLLPLQALKNAESRDGGSNIKSKDKKEKAASTSREEVTAEMMEAAGQAWVAPEVQEGEPHTQHSDLFSYGGVLFEILAQQLPPMESFRKSSKKRAHPRDSVDALEDVFMDDPATAGIWMPKMPVGVDAHPGQVQLMQRCLRRERGQRPGGFYVVVSFLHDLVKSLGGDKRRKRPETVAVSPNRGAAVAIPAAGSDDESGAVQALRLAAANAQLEQELESSQERCRELEVAAAEAAAAAASGGNSNDDGDGDGDEGGTLRSEELRAKLEEVEEREASLKRTLEAANEREQTMRLELEREQASARELQTQISDGRQREEKLKAQNAALPTHSTEGTPSKIRSRKRVDSTGSVEIPPSGLSRLQKSDDTGEAETETDGRSRGRRERRESGEGTAEDDRAEFRRLQKREKQLAKELEAEKKQRSKLEKILQDEGGMSSGSWSMGTARSTDTRATRRDVEEWERRVADVLASSDQLRAVAVGSTPTSKRGVSGSPVHKSRLMSTERVRSKSVNPSAYSSRITNVKTRSSPSSSPPARPKIVDGGSGSGRGRDRRREDQQRRSGKDRREKDKPQKRDADGKKAKLDVRYELKRERSLRRKLLQEKIQAEAELQKLKATLKKSALGNSGRGSGKRAGSNENHGAEIDGTRGGVDGVGGGNGTKPGHGAGGHRNSVRKTMSLAAVRSEASAGSMVSASTTSISTASSSNAAAFGIDPMHLGANGAGMGWAGVAVGGAESAPWATVGGGDGVGAGGKATGGGGGGGVALNPNIIEQQLQRLQLQLQQQQQAFRRQQQQLQASQSMAAYSLPMGIMKGGDDKQRRASIAGGGGRGSLADSGDRESLKVLFRRCGGQKWLQQVGWREEIGERYGVAWTLDRVRATKLELGSNGLTNCIPKELGMLSCLLCLRLDHNKIIGVIPPELGQLSMLQQLELQSNRLTGSIPRELGNLSCLHYLGLHDNQLMGEIPKDLGRLTYLKHLALCNNRLVGPIPKEVGGLSLLEQLYLNHNMLTGPIPGSIGNLSNLNKLRLECNNIGGVIPVEIGNLKKLQYVNLGYNGNGNSLCGEVPIRAFANMPVLAWLSMTDNPDLIVKRGRFGVSTLSLLKKAVPAKCDVFV